MAELALGLTKTVVEGTLSRLQSAIEEEAKFQESVQRNLVFITGEFQMMQSFLQIATKERARNEVVRTCVHQLRDLAFDVEDCVEFVVHLDNKDKTGTWWWWRVMPSCLAPPRPLDVVADEIKLLKARVEDVSQRNTRYNILIGDGSGCSSHSKTVTSDTTSTSPAAAALFQILRQVWKDETDKLRDEDSLQKLITREGDNDLQVISLWGSDSLEAMSYVIDKAYHDPEICKGFQWHARVKMTHPFCLEEFLDRLLAQLLFVGSPHQATNKGLTSPANAKLNLIQQATTQQRYLVIVEQVSDTAEWDLIKMCLPDSKNGSRIILSTQHLGVALYCTGEPYLVSELRRFSDGRPSLCAFYKKVPGSSGSYMDELKSQIKRGGVIGVCGDGRTKSHIVKRLYRSIMLNQEEFDGVRFQKQRWVPVPTDHPFNLDELSRRLIHDKDYGFFDGGLGDLRKISFELENEEIRDLLRLNHEQVIERSRVILRSEGNCLVVIDGLRSEDEWDVIKSTFLSEPTNCCVVVVTNEISVAKHCVGGNEVRLVQVREADVSKGRIFSCRKEEAIGSLRSIFRETLHGEWWEIHKLMWSSEQTHAVVSVWGIAGVGKSTQVRYAYSHYVLIDHDNDDDYYNYSYQLWVDVPQHPFSLTELSLRLLLEFHSDDPQAKEAALVAVMEGEDPIQVCRDWLRHHAKWLLVLDGVESTDDWDSVKAAFCLPSDPASGCRIVVITNERSVASHCVDKNDEQIVNIKGLQAEPALRFFTQKVERCLRDYDMEIAKHIMPKCGGLPKVIAAIAEYCNKEWYLDLGLRSINHFFMHKLEYDVLGFRSLSGQFSWMRSYLETCEDELKPCIFYLPVFPMEHNIRQKRLVRRWIAEGYSRDTSSGTALQNGENLFDKLVSRSIIQEQPSSKPSMCRVNGFFHEYITSRPLEDNLVFALEGSCKLNTQRMGQHLSIRSSWDRDMNVFRGTDFSRLRSFTVFGDCKPFKFDSPESTNMKHVRVLDLEDASGVTDDHLQGILELLPRLKFLSLRGCREITRLPKSIGGMRQLQTLDVRYTSIATLPEAILKLQKLQYVRAGSSHSVPWDEGGTMVTCEPTASGEEAEVVATAQAEGSSSTAAAASSVAPEDDSSTTAAAAQTAPAGESTTTAAAAPRSMTNALVPSWLSKLYGRHRPDNANEGVNKVPAGFGNLTSLHTFGIANVGAGKAAILNELRNLSQLHRLGVCGINPDNIHEFFSSISGLRHLESLTVRLDKNRKGSFASLDHTISAPPKTLRSLKLHGHLCIRSRSWIKELDPHLRRIDLEVTVASQQDMDVVVEELMAVPGIYVHRLCVKPIRVGELHIAKAEQQRYGYGIFHVDVLEIICTSHLQATIRGLYVEVLKVHCTIGSSLQLSGLLENSSIRVSLKEVWLKGSYSNDLKQDLLRHLAQHQGHSVYEPVLKLLRPRSS